MKVSASRENATDRLLAELLEDVAQRMQTGQPVDLEAYVAQYGECARQLKQLLPTVQFLVDTPSSPPSLPGTLGDFRILREIGRGGMGVVYEAQQASLRRRVALKVFAFAPLLDRRQLQRFKNEAQAAASLEHANIVRVYSVGCDRGVYYYAMQYVQGQDLAQVIEGLWQLSEPALPGDNKEAVTPLVVDTAAGRLPARVEESRQTVSVTVPSSQTPPRIPPVVKARRGAEAPIPPSGSARSRAFYRTVAALGIQAADALEHAHQMGIVHRDVKPSNLLMDQEGHLWVTDFGLARTQIETSLTRTGDLLGTLRYMSPEQVRAKHGVLDHRSDVYSLAVTLYELLTLRKAFEGDDRQDLARRIVEEEPRAPGVLNKAVPRDLETIVLKAMAKEPQARYQTAKALADDLRRFLRGEPVRARRATLVQRATKWGYRHRYLVSAAIAIAFAVLLTATGLIWRGQRQEAAIRRQAEEQRTEAEEQRAQAEENLRLALELVDQTYLRYGKELWLGYGEGADSDYPQVVTPKGREFLRKALAVYERAAAANGEGPAATERAARASGHVANIRSLLGMHAEAKAAAREAVERAEALVRQYPDEPQYQACLGQVLVDEGNVWGRAGDLVRAGTYYAEAIRVQPNNATAYYNRANIYWDRHDFARAVADYTEAIRLDPTHADAYNNRGRVFCRKGDYDKAVADHSKALDLDPKDPKAYVNRAYAYWKLGELDRAIDDSNQAIRLDPKHAGAYLHRGNAYAGKGEIDKAIADFDRAIQFDQRFAEAYNNRGYAKWKYKAEFREAISDLREAVRLDPRLVDAYANLAVLLASCPESTLRNVDEAIELAKKTESVASLLGITQPFGWRGRCAG